LIATFLVNPFPGLIALGHPADAQQK